MVFSSTVFLFWFLPIFLTVYYICPSKLRNAFLFLASLLFYAWEEPIYILIMLFSTIFDYVNGLLLEKSKSTLKRRVILIVSIIGNLSILGFFKYSDFFITNINFVFHTNMNLLKLALPVGISFYTFQTMSYTIDVYRKKVSAQKNIINFAAYVTMFPQLVAGPIVRYKTIAEQLNKRHESIDRFVYGIQRFIIGLFKKVMIANNIGLLWETITATNLETLPAATAWLGAVSFSFQIYFDFSGYSDMAIGLGEMIGFHFLENFDHPYISKSITEFWRRWHISLSTWFKEYVYIPLGGSRHGIKKQIRNLFIVWGITGFWHGASWNFVLWGLYFGILLIIEKLFLLKFLEKTKPLFKHIYTLFFVVISWVIFAFEDLSQIVHYIKAMFFMNHSGVFNAETLYLFSSYIILLLICVILSVDWKQTKLAAFLTSKSLKESKILKPLKIKWIRHICSFLFFTTLFIVSISFLIGETYNPFLYFRF